MKLLAATVLAVLASSAAASKAKRNHHHSDILRARQFHPRDAAGVCANLENSPLAVTISGESVTIGDIDSCLCTSDIADFVVHDDVAAAAAVLVGETAVSNTVSSLISAAAASNVCAYPAGATPTCIGTDPCGFTCSSGHTPSPAISPTVCACSGGHCPSSSASMAARRKRENPWADAECPASYSACGVPGSPHSWECVDTMSDIESCGGCTLPLQPSAARGVDCTEIPGVASVACVHGGCAVKSCRNGWTVSSSGDACVELAEEPYTESAVEGILRAMHFGLEHTPL